MNMKKGLTRLFLFGLIISVIVGFVFIDKKALSNNETFYLNEISEIENEIIYPECKNMLKLDDKDKIPDYFNYNGNCNSILLFWDDIKYAQIKTKTQNIDFKFVSETLNKKRYYNFWERFLGTILLFFIGYIVFCFSVWLVFISLRWVKRGFSA